MRFGVTQTLDVVSEMRNRVHQRKNIIKPIVGFRRGGVHLLSLGEEEMRQFSRIPILDLEDLSRTIRDPPLSGVLRRRHRDRAVTAD